MYEEFLRTEMMLGGEALGRLRRCHVAVFGLGGVGSYAAEALCRAGIGELTARHMLQSNATIMFLFFISSSSIFSSQENIFCFPCDYVSLLLNTCIIAQFCI